MTRTKLLIVSFLVSLGLAACGGEEPPRPPAPPATSSPDEPSDRCLEDRCGRQIERCDDLCWFLIECVGECSDDSCVDFCFGVTPPESIQQVANLVECNERNCS